VEFLFPLCNRLKRDKNSFTCCKFLSSQGIADFFTHFRSSRNWVKAEGFAKPVLKVSQISLSRSTVLAGFEAAFCWEYSKGQKLFLVEMQMIPFIHRKFGKPFYGWYIVGVAFLALFVSVGATIDALAVFLKPMTEGLGWTRTMLMGAITVASIATALTSPLVGRIIDHRGARLLMPVGAIAGSGLLVGLSSVTQI
jgi:MFS family permease